MTWFSPWLRGWQYDIFTLETGASFFTLLFYLTMFYIFDLYNVERYYFTLDMILRMSIAVCFAGFFSIFLFFYIPQFGFSRSIFLIQILLVWFLSSTVRLLFIKLFLNYNDKKDVLVLGAGESGLALYNLLKDNMSPYRIVGFVDDNPKSFSDCSDCPPILGRTEDLLDIIKSRGIKILILAISRNNFPKLIRDILKARLQGIQIIEMPTLFERFTNKIPVEHIDDGWLVFTEGFNLISKEYLWNLKHLFDFFISLIMLIIFAPIMLVIAILIRIDSPGPVLFIQKRVGLNGKIFDIFKFRSMKVDSEIQGAVWASENDIRITRIGKLLRFLRIDELPQLLNVFQGEMSLIGPRPERPEFVKELEIGIPYYHIRHTVRPGITGWAQVNYPYGASQKDALNKLEYDLFYIKNMSLLLDFKIILKTIGVILFGQGAR